MQVMHQAAMSKPSMAKQDPVRNTYEEFADELKETLAITETEKGQVPSTKASKETLLHDHDWHLMFLAKCAMPPRNIILPLPYQPSKTPLPDTQSITLRDLYIGSRATNTLLVLRTITDPYVYSSTVTIAEDEAGDAARLTICNLDDSVDDPVVPKGLILAIKQPCWSKVPGGGYHIRVDHPVDVVILDPSDKRAPPAWRQDSEAQLCKDFGIQMKKASDMVLKKRFRRALELYKQTQNIELSEPATQIRLYKQRYLVNLLLFRYDDAAENLAHAISLHFQSEPSLPLRDYTNPQTISAWLHNRTAEDDLQITAILPKLLRDSAARIRFDLGIYQSHADYDLHWISSHVGRTLRVDVASYIGDTEVKQTTHHGRGLFAKRAFKSGDLIMAEKAFALPQYAFNDPSSECCLYSLGDGTTADRAGTLLFQELVKKLRHNASLRAAFFDLDDGGYWKENGWPIEDGEDVPIDVFRIEHIRRRNCFSAPLRSLDLLTTPMPVRNGFWKHSSYVNHACLPNSVRTFMGDMLFLRASRDIEEGEEITSHYVAPALTYMERQQKFEHTWAFICDCTSCAVDKKAGKALEDQRLAIFEELKSTAQKLSPIPTVTALKKMAKRMRDLEALYDDDAYAALPRLCLVHPTLFLTEAWRSLKNVDRMLEYANKLLKYFGFVIRIEGESLEVCRNAGLINVETVRALKYLAEGYETKSQTALAGSIRGMARIWLRVITGAEVGMEEFMRK